MLREDTSYDESVCFVTMVMIMDEFCVIKVTNINHYLLFDKSVLFVVTLLGYVA